MNLETHLARLVRETPDIQYRPRLFSLPKDREALEALLEKGEVLRCQDLLREQLYELLSARTPSRQMDPQEREEALLEHLGKTPLMEYGTWVYYPWSGCLVHVLPEQEYRALRSDRNRYKITTEEQARLRQATLGIVGLSVGSAAALTLACEGVGGKFRLADFDNLSLSNLNRLRASVCDLGVNKAVLAARAMYELDPYLDIQIYPEGITEENLEDFLTGAGRLDLLIEECDDLTIKVLLRERAWAHRIPVLMETSERGLLDIERFDREPTRPIFHGLLGDPAPKPHALSHKERGALVLRILGGHLSSAAAASMLEYKESLSTWPQLASAVALGGALVTDAARRILLERLTSSGRFSVDLEALVREGAQIALPPPLWSGEVSAEALSSPSLPPLPSPGEDEPTVEEIRFLVSAAVLAPSGGNRQPWRFVFREGRLRCALDPERASSLLDVRGLASCAALGAAVENIRLAAPVLGLSPHVRFEDEAHTPAYEISFTRKKPSPPSSLFLQIPMRLTNRRAGEKRPLAAEHHRALREVVQEQGGALLLLTEEKALARLGELIGAGERLRFLSEGLRRDLMQELRFSPEEVEATRDGIDVATLEAHPADIAALRLLARPEVAARLAQAGGGKALERPSREALCASSAAGLLCVEGVSPACYAHGGGLLQRLWLTATAYGLSLQPLSALPYLFARLEREAGEGLGQEERHALKALRDAYLNLFPVREGWAEVLLFRLFYAERATARSLRRPVEEVLVVEA